MASACSPPPERGSPVRGPCPLAPSPRLRVSLALQEFSTHLPMRTLESLSAPAFQPSWEAEGEAFKNPRGAGAGLGTRPRNPGSKTSVWQTKRQGSLDSYRFLKATACILRTGGQMEKDQLLKIKGMKTQLSCEAQAGLPVIRMWPPCNSLRRTGSYMLY